MPKSPIWYSRLPEILSRLGAHGAPPLLDRAAVEQLFGVSRRQAIRILNTAKGYQVGKTFIVETQALAMFLDGIEQSGAGRDVRARKQRIAATLNEVANYAEAQRVEIRPRSEALSHKTSHPPSAFELIGPGKLQISYDNPEDLLARIVELASAAANDFPAFRRLYGGGR